MGNCISLDDLIGRLVYIRNQDIARGEKTRINLNNKLNDIKQNIITDDGSVIRIKNEDGSISVSAEDVARGYGWVQTKSGIEYLRFERINKYIKDMGVKEAYNKGDYVPLDIVFRLENISRAYNKHLFVDNICKFLNIERPILEQQQRFEHSFRELLLSSMKPLGYNVIPQYILDNGKYRVDFYIEDLNLAVEYDESHHNNKNNKQKDIERQVYIEEKLNCKFIRCDYRESDAYNLGLVFKAILNN